MSSKKAGKHAGDAHRMSDDDDLVLEQSKQEVVYSEDRVLFFLSSLFVAAIPIYVYQKIYFLPVESHFLVFVAITLAAAALLWFAHTYQMKHRVEQVETQMRQYTVSESSVPASRKRLEAVAYALFFNNTIFLLSFMFFGFYAFARANDTVNYLLSVPLSGAIAYAISYDMAH